MSDNRFKYPVNYGQSVRLGAGRYITSQYGQANINGVALAEGNFQEILDTGVDDDSSELRQYCIQTMIGGYSLPTEGEPRGRKLAILGRLIWGVGGVTMQCDFDWKMGNQISVAASFFRLQAAYSEIVNGPPEVGISAMFSSGGRAARSQATRTYPLLTLLEGDVVIFPVPPMAHALNLFASTDGDDNDFYDDGVIGVRYLGGASAGFSAASTDLCAFQSDASPFAAALANEDGVRFPESTRFVEIAAPSETETVYYVTPCFTLNL